MILNTKRIIMCVCALLLCAATLSSCLIMNVDLTETDTKDLITSAANTKTEKATETEIKTETEQVIETEKETVPETATEEVTETETEKVTETEAQTTAKETETAKEESSYNNEYGFKADLSKYEKYLDPENRDEYLILVNPDNPLNKYYEPDDLTKLVDTRSDRSKRKMRLYAAMALEAFLKEARANGCKDVTVTSAYRSYSDQESVFNSDVEKYMKKGMTKEEAIAKTRADTAYPGESEHQSGLAVDMHNMSSAQVAFAKTYEAKWLAENAWKFGFILRYPEGKEDITTYTYEPWHFRYVGRYHAKQIYDMGMCLEEYIDYLNEQ